MATGISRHEKLGSDAITAELPHRDPHPLPTQTEEPYLAYRGQVSDKEILSPLSSAFSKVDAKSITGISAIDSNSLILADNLFVLHQLLKQRQKAALIYLDPPYNTGMQFQSRQLQHSYNDRWGTAAYVEFMRRRFILMRELLNDDGSIYVHIGHQMLGHIKVILDEVFGPNNFRNLITRRKCSSKNFTSKSFANLHDYILFYSKTKNYIWNQPGERPTDEWIEKEYPKVDRRGRYKLVPVHAPGTRGGQTGEPWRGVKPPPGKHWQYTPSKLDELDNAGEMHWSKTGNPRRKVYLTKDKLVPYTDHWTQFRDAHHQSIAVTGYPTEKNLDMLKLIVSASSNDGDLVIDPFCGSGTTLHAAHELGRKWIGVDQSFIAIESTIRRFRHGSKPMGDFVDRNSNELDENIVDLFPSHVNEATSNQRKDTLKDAKFSLVVDDELLEPFHSEIKTMASL